MTDPIHEWISHARTVPDSQKRRAVRLARMKNYSAIAARYYRATLYRDLTNEEYLRLVDRHQAAVNAMLHQVEHIRRGT